MDKKTYLKEENWFGSYYELAIEYSPGRNDELLLKALKTIWGSSLFEGPWLNKKDFRNSTVSITAIEPKGFNRLYGSIKLTDDMSVGCETMIIHEEVGSDWLDICIPTGMLELIQPLDYRSLHTNNRWLESVDNAFVRISEEIFRVAPFNLARIGEEVSGEVYADQLTDELLSEGGYIIPSTTYDKIKVELGSVELLKGLWWIPYGRGDAHII